eukprot:421646-Hanusia_phi.AAC.2
MIHEISLADRSHNKDLQTLFDENFIRLTDDRFLQFDDLAADADAIVPAKDIERVESFMEKVVTKVENILRLVVSREKFGVWDENLGRTKRKHVVERLEEDVRSLIHGFHERISVTARVSKMLDEMEKTMMTVERQVMVAAERTQDNTIIRSTMPACSLVSISQIAVSAEDSQAWNTICDLSIDAKRMLSRMKVCKNDSSMLRQHLLQLQAQVLSFASQQQHLNQKLGDQYVRRRSHRRLTACMHRWHDFLHWRKFSNMRTNRMMRVIRSRQSRMLLSSSISMWRLLNDRRHAFNRISSSLRSRHVQVLLKTVFLRWHESAWGDKSARQHLNNLLKIESFLSSKVGGGSAPAFKFISATQVDCFSESCCNLIKRCAFSLARHAVTTRTALQAWIRLATCSTTKRILVDRGRRRAARRKIERSLKVWLDQTDRHRWRCEVTKRKQSLRVVRMLCDSWWTWLHQLQLYRRQTDTLAELISRSNSRLLQLTFVKLQRFHRDRCRKRQALRAVREEVQQLRLVRMLATCIDDLCRRRAQIGACCADVHVSEIAHIDERKWNIRLMKDSYCCSKMLTRSTLNLAVSDEKVGKSERTVVEVLGNKEEYDTFLARCGLQEVERRRKEEKLCNEDDNDVGKKRRQAEAQMRRRMEGQDCLSKKQKALDRASRMSPTSSSSQIVNGQLDASLS